MESSKRITISGYYGYGNLGDEAILESLIGSLHKRFGSALEIVVLSNDPERTEREHGVNAVSRWNPIKILLTLYNSEVLISGGGGLSMRMCGVTSTLIPPKASRKGNANFKR